MRPTARVVGVGEWVTPARPGGLDGVVRGEPALARGATLGLDEATGLPALFPSGVGGTAWRGDAWRRLIDVFIMFFEWLEAESFTSTRGTFRICNLSTDLLGSDRREGSAPRVDSVVAGARSDVSIDPCNYRRPLLIPTRVRADRAGSATIPAARRAGLGGDGGLEAAGLSNFRCNTGASFLRASSLFVTTTRHWQSSPRRVRSAMPGLTAANAVSGAPSRTGRAREWGPAGPESTRAVWPGWSGLRLR
jgi:hypothetical protein